MNRTMLGAAAALLLATCSGCVEKSTDNGASTYTFQAWVPASLIAAGLAFVPLGVWLWRRDGKKRWLLVSIAGPVAACVIAPGMFDDKVIVDDQGFYSRHGFWFAPIEHQIKYADLSNVQLFVKESRRRGRTSTSYEFDCDFKSGKSERVPLGDIMREAYPEIVQQFHKHAVSGSFPSTLP